jgi:hypothetical protein
MARLGSVLGAILAELTRARFVADELTRDLVSEYRKDSILSSMSVPRIVLDEAALTLRFGVSDVQEAPQPALDAGSVRDAWVPHAVSMVLPRVLDRLGVAPDEHAAIIDTFTETAGRPLGVPPLTEVRRAIAGERLGMAIATAKPVLDTWSALPSRIRTTLGTKTTFRRELERNLREELDVFIERQHEAALVKAALASRLDVAVSAQDLPQDPGLVQEFRITVRGQDLELLLEGDGAGS